MVVVPKAATPSIAARNRYCWPRHHWNNRLTRHRQMMRVCSGKWSIWKTIIMAMTCHWYCISVWKVEIAVTFVPCSCRRRATTTTIVVPCSCQNKNLEDRLSNLNVPILNQQQQQQQHRQSLSVVKRTTIIIIWTRVTPSRPAKRRPLFVKLVGT